MTSHRATQRGFTLLEVLVVLMITSLVSAILFQGLVAWFALETYRFLGLFTTSVLIWPESLFVLPILLGAVDILITELIYLYWVLMRRPLPAPRAMPAAVE